MNREDLYRFLYLLLLVINFGAVRPHPIHLFRSSNSAIIVFLALNGISLMIQVLSTGCLLVI